MLVSMENNASRLIDAFGGTSKTAKLAGLPISTVHSWRSNGIPKSRLSHLRLVAKAERVGFNFDEMAHGVTPDVVRPTEDAAA